MVMEEPGLILFLIAHMVRSSVILLCSNVQAAGTCWENNDLKFSLSTSYHFRYRMNIYYI